MPLVLKHQSTRPRRPFWVSRAPNECCCVLQTTLDVRLSVCLSVSPSPVCLSVCPSACLSVCRLSVWPSSCLSSLSPPGGLASRTSHTQYRCWGISISPFVHLELADAHCARFSLDIHHEQKQAVQTCECVHRNDCTKLCD